MARRIIRSLAQLVAFTIILCILLFFADSRYRVLPTSIHNHLPMHHAGLVVTDIDIAFCSSANPFSACELDRSQWFRIPKDLYLGKGWLSSAWLHVKRKRETDLTPEDHVVIDLRISRLAPDDVESGLGTPKWEARPGGIWIARRTTQEKGDLHHAVTAVDVLFGSDAAEPRLGWSLIPAPLILSASLRDFTPRLSVRRGAPQSDIKTVVPRVNKDGRFKILQVSDAHLSTGVGKCRDTYDSEGHPSESCEADTRTLEFIDSILDEEKPDLVVLTGDQIEGPAAPDPQSALFKIVAPLVERNIPYAAIFGNHDDEGPQALSRDGQMAILKTLPLSLSEAGPAEVTGVGNYYFEVLASSPSQHSAITVYMLDSHAMSHDKNKGKGYDWIQPSQIDWFKTTAQSLKKNHDKYSHIHMNLAFIHIPLPEVAEQPQNVQGGGQWKEGSTAPRYNSHFYNALTEEGVVAVGFGHDHANDYCAMRPAKAMAAAEQTDQSVHHNAHKIQHSGPWMCYAGGAGFGGYGGYGDTQRRVRIWDFDMPAGRLVTWKRVECCGVDTKNMIDEIVLVEGGVVRESV